VLGTPYLISLATCRLLDHVLNTQMLNMRLPVQQWSKTTFD
jgi:hypothetical protein